MKRIWMFVAASLGIPILIWIGGEVVMHLWNWNLPALFGFRQITFWQAIGLFALCRILFGGVMGGGGGRSNPGRRMRRRVRERMNEHWEEMTPEERERLHQGLHRRDRRTTPLDPNPSL